MAELLSAAEMRAIEGAAMGRGTVSGLELMERAGQGAVDAMLARWPDLMSGARRASVLCGPGNNGGDGFVVARLMRDAGWSVTVFLLGDARALRGDARVNHDRWEGAVESLDAAIADGRYDHPDALAAHSDVIVDALFGTGLNRPLDQEVLLPLLSGLQMHVAEPRTAGEAARAPWVVALDMPSGLCSDSGRVLVPEGAGRALAVAAHLTVTFHALKRGHVLAEGPAHCGEIAVVDIGLRQGGDRRWRDPACATVVDLVERRDVAAAAVKSGAGHKFDHGHAVVLSGGVGHGGAARMAARAALRIGAGLVTVGCPPAALIENAAQLNAIMLRRVTDAAALAEILEDDRINALCLGPGLGTGDREADLVRAALSGRRGVVLDGDALTILSRDAGLMEMLHQDCVLTPHGGEFARLFPDIAERLDAPATRGPAYSKVDAAREAAARVGCVMVFKGPDTVIATPHGRCAVHGAVYERAAPWLATAGAGDVLAGFVTGLMARRFAPMRAAEMAAWLHVGCARAAGPGMIAEDLPEAVPGVLRAMGPA